MSLQREDLDNPGEDLGRRVADYLVAHPGFFERFPDALAAIDIPHPTGDAVSLIERQVSVLREQNQHYRSQLQDLIGVARENDALAKRLHRLTLALIETRSFDEVLNTLQDELRTLFEADAVEMKLFSAEQLEEHASEPGPAMFHDFLERQRPSCGRLSAEQLDYLFGSQAGETGSVALIPLQSSPLVGVLAIGSRDPERFHSSKGVDFLQRLADVVSATLTAVSSPGV